MARDIKGGSKNGKAAEPRKEPIPEVKRDMLGELAEDDMAVDFGEIHPASLHSVIARVCRSGGYIGFSAPAGGASVKLRCSVGDAGLERWARSGTQLASLVLAIHKFLEADAG